MNILFIQLQIGDWTWKEKTKVFFSCERKWQFKAWTWIQLALYILMDIIMNNITDIIMNNTVLEKRLRQSLFFEIT